LNGHNLGFFFFAWYQTLYPPCTAHNKPKPQASGKRSNNAVTRALASYQHGLLSNPDSMTPCVGIYIYIFLVLLLALMVFNQAAWGEPVSSSII